MTTGPRQETAQIFQFPTRLRPPAHDARTGSRHGARPSGAWVPPTVATDFGSGWYHEAAMQESDPSAKH